MRIAVTCGEPAGIGPDLCIQLIQQHPGDELVFIGDRRTLQERAQQLRLPLPLNTIESADARLSSDPREINLLQVDLAEPTVPGQLNSANSEAVLETLRRAANGCLEGHFDAMVTAPIHKGVINDAGIPFTGHTEFLAQLTGGFPVMMLACPGLRVALVTTHLPLKDVSGVITEKLVKVVTRILHRDLQARFAIEHPKILVCGLNPHAGEEGHLGREELDTIMPALEQLRTEGIVTEGPLPADTIFTPRYLERADAVLAMYHDQGLPVLKHMGFGNAVNITLGLPIIRTSVDHGTALDLAGSGNADCGSLVAAIETARQMTRR